MEAHHKRILLLGSGYMAESVIRYLLKRPENHIVVASNILKDAEKLCENRANCKPAYIDVNDQNSLREFIQHADIVVSYVPAIFHPKVAAICIEQKKHMVTASYISPDLAKLDHECKEKGLIFLNEVGLDPGIDHLATFKVLNEVQEKGGKVVGYESWCGGLISPECIDNPFGYKFTWSPIGAMRALKNEAKYLTNGQETVIPSSDLLYISKPMDINMALNLEGYPNRDSLRYIDIYGLKDATHVLRGTLRFGGFTLLARSLIELGLFSEEQVAESLRENGTWKHLIKHLVESEEGVCARLSNETVNNLVKDLGIDVHDEALCHKILNKVFKNKHYDANESPDSLLSKAKKILSLFKWSKFLDETTKLGEGKTYLELLVNNLEKRMAIQPGERDLIVMQHIFKIQWPHSHKLEIRKSTLIAFGEKNMSAMALLVGLPTAVSTQLILDGVITRTGVIMPSTKDIYEPLTKKLEELGVNLKEETE